MSDNYDSEIRRLQEQRKLSSASGAPSDAEDTNASNYGISLSGRGHFDSDIYGNSEFDKSLYLDSVQVDDFEEEDSDLGKSAHPSTRRQINGSRALIDSSLEHSEDSMDPMKYREQFGSGLVDTRISSRESEVRNIYIPISIFFVSLF
jgi:hypothetical protein